MNPYALRFLFAYLVIAAAGCASIWSGGDEDDDQAKLDKLMSTPTLPPLVRDAAAATGLNSVEVEGVGLVNQLPGTGGPPDPSAYRNELLEDMRRRDVESPNRLLEKESTALVRVRTTIPPGARRGDALDLRLVAPKESRTADLAGGWLLETRMRQQMKTRTGVRTSDVLAVGTGPLLTRAAHYASADETANLEARVISGGRVQETRKLGLIIRPDHQHVETAKAIAAAINERFFFFDGTTRRGIAKPVNDDTIEIDAHPRYGGNLPRMMAVISSVGVAGRRGSQQRLIELGRMMGDPTTARDASLQLEAIGDAAVPTLLDALKSSNEEIRFYAAEALAYLDRVEAVEPLELAIREVAAFRGPALVALAGIERASAIEALRRLLHEPSLETRYGAFDAIRDRDDGRPLLDGGAAGPFWLYRVDSDAPPAIIVSLRNTHEIVLIGDPPTIQLKKFMRGPRGILIQPTGENGDQIEISRFEVGKDDRHAAASTRIDSLLEALVAVGAGYGDVVRILREAKASGAIDATLAIDPLPGKNRTYHRDQSSMQVSKNLANR